MAHDDEEDYISDMSVREMFEVLMQEIIFVCADLKEDIRNVESTLNTLLEKK